MNKYLSIALMIGFFLVGLNVFLNSKPTPKAPIYKTITKYSPYYLEKRFGGLEILNRDDKDFKEKPDNVVVFKRFEQLQKQWGKKHLKIVNNTLIIDSNHTQIKVHINSQKDKNFLKTFYGL